MFFHEVMHILAKSVIAISRKAKHRLRRFKALPRLQPKRKVFRIDTADKPGLAVSTCLKCTVMITTVNQIDSVNLAGSFSHSRLSRHHERITPAAAASLLRVKYQFAARQQIVTAVHLMRPRTSEACNLQNRCRKLQATRKKPLNLNRTIRGIHQPYASRDNILLRVYKVMHFQRLAVGFVLQNHEKMLVFAAVIIGMRKL